MFEEKYTYFSREECEAARARLAQWGMSQIDLAKKFGVSKQLVQSIIHGRNRCLFGTAHHVAVALGLKKEAESVPEGRIERRLGAQKDILRVCEAFPVLPVLTFEDAGRAVEMCGALLEGGAAALEITFRTPSAPQVLAAVAAAYPRATVAAGSVRTAQQLQMALEAGAGFAVSPGATPALLGVAERMKMPLLPGAATASEVMALREAGYVLAKFFPAQAMGGAAALAALAGPLPEVRFCPTGGVTPENAGAYLALPNVVCVGGSWLVRDGDDAKAVYEKTVAAGRLAGARRGGSRSGGD